MRPEQPSDPTPRTIDVAGRSVAFTDEGEGPTLVALHGYPGSHRDFRWLASVLAPRARFVRIDMPGFGESPDHPEHAPCPATDASLLLEVLAALHVERPVLLAHSMGGAVAVRAATDAPSRFAGLALLAVPGLSPHQHLRRIPVRPLSRAFRPPAVRRLLAPLASRLGAAAGFPKSIPVSTLYRSVDWAAAYDPLDHAERCRRIEQPCMLAYAVDDALVEPAIGDALAEILPSGPRLRFDAGGHNVQKTQAVPVGEALLGFLGSTALRAAG